jgi:hypothetical protein
MLEQLIALLGKSIESDEIRSLFTEWNVAFPKKTFCTANVDSIGSCKMEREGMKMYFTRGANSRFMKPIKGVRKSSFICLFSMIEFQKKRKGPIPFGVKHDMTYDELTAILGKPKTNNVVSQSTVWRKTYEGNYELIVSDEVYSDGKKLRSITFSYVYEPDLYTLEDYEKAGL